MKSFIPYFFAILFISVLMTPTIISLVDNTQEIGMYVDINEEEENKNETSLTEFVIQLHAASNNIKNGIEDPINSENISFELKNYRTNYFKIDTPPPKHKVF